MLPGMISGYISDHIGYQQFFIWALASAIPAFILTWKLPFTHPDTKEQAEKA
jgi:PAT family beta-lactamase induction signal transducer AmpG